MGRKGGNGCKLGNRRRGDEDILHHATGCIEQGVGHNHPADAPAGHRPSLGEAVDDDGAPVIAAGKRAGRFVAVGQAVVNLVGNQPAALFGADRGDGGKFAILDERAGRIAGVNHDRGARVDTPVLRDQLAGQVIAGLRADRDIQRLAAGQADEVSLARVAGVGQQHRFAGFEQHGIKQIECAGGAGGYQETLGGNAQVVFVRVPVGERLLQRRRAGGRRVEHIAAIQMPLRRFNHRRGRGKIRLADFHVNDAPACGFQFLRALQQLHHAEGFDGINASHGGFVSSGLRRPCAAVPSSVWPDFCGWPLLPRPCSGRCRPARGRAHAGSGRP